MRVSGFTKLVHEILNGLICRWRIWLLGGDAGQSGEFSAEVKS